MRARDLLSNLPTVSQDAPVMVAARLLTQGDLPGLMVIDAQGTPSGVIPGTQVLRLAIPHYFQDDPLLTRVIAEEQGDAILLSSLDQTTIAEALSQRAARLPTIGPDATALEVAELMARTHSPLVAVVEDGRLIGAVTLQKLLDRLLA